MTSSEVATLVVPATTTFVRKTSGRQKRNGRQSVDTAQDKHSPLAFPPTLPGTLLMHIYGPLLNRKKTVFKRKYFLNRASFCPFITSPLFLYVLLFSSLSVGHLRQFAFLWVNAESRSLRVFITGDTPSCTQANSEQHLHFAVKRLFVASTVFLFMGRRVFSHIASSPNLLLLLFFHCSIKLVRRITAAAMCEEKTHWHD